MRSIISLTEQGRAKLQGHLAETGNSTAIPFEQAFKNLVAVLASQINNKNPELAKEPWYFAIGVYGTTYPRSFAEHETSDYEEVCLEYREADFLIEDGGREPRAHPWGCTDR